MFPITTIRTGLSQRGNLPVKMRHFHQFKLYQIQKLDKGYNTSKRTQLFLSALISFRCLDLSGLKKVTVKFFSDMLFCFLSIWVTFYFKGLLALKLYYSRWSTWVFVFDYASI